MKTKTLLAALAVSSLVLAQPAAAATRSYESLPQNGAKVGSADRAGSIGDQSEELVGLSPFILILLLSGALAAIIAATNGHKSPA